MTESLPQQKYITRSNKRWKKINVVVTSTKAITRYVPYTTRRPTMTINNPLPISNEDEEAGKHLDAMHPELARRTVKWYVCSRCWSDLQMQDSTDGVRVECVRCGEETYGYVTRKWTERKRSDDHFEALEVTRMLQRIGVLPKPERRTEKQILSQLGY